MRVAYADPPYIGQAKLYKDHADYAGEVDHAELATTLLMYDGWLLHSSSTAMFEVETHLRDAGHEDFRRMAWVKPFAAFKRNVSIAYAWEPVFVKAARKPVVKKDMGFTYRDWLAESITLKRGLTGAKPEKVVHWLLEAVGAQPHDHFHDMYLGTGAVTRAWESWMTLHTARAEDAA